MFKKAKAFSSFSVNNIQKAKDFYAKTLGLDVSETMEDMLSLRIEGGNEIYIYSKEDHVPATFTILNFPVDDIEQTIDLLKKRNVRFEQYNKPNLKTDEKGICSWDGAKMAWFKDPAGNILSIIEEK